MADKNTEKMADKTAENEASAEGVSTESIIESLTQKYSYGQKAATIIASLGTEKAAKVYKYLDEEDVEKLTIEVAKLGHIDSKSSEVIMDEFYKSCITQKVVTDGGIEYARAVLEKTYGEEQAEILLHRMNKMLMSRTFDFLRQADTKSLYMVLQGERPQTIALVLSYAEPAQVAVILAELPGDVRLKVVESIAKMESASPEVISLIEAQIQKKMASVSTTNFTAVGGIDYTADVMNHMDRNNEKFIFDEMTKNDPVLVDEIRKRMFVFEDIMEMDARSIQRFLRDCDVRDLVYALKNASSEMLGVFFSNMSERMASNIRDDLEITYNVRLKDVEEAQQRIVAIIRKLDEEGEIIVSKSGKDDIIA